MCAASTQEDLVAYSSWGFGSEVVTDNADQFPFIQFHLIPNHIFNLIENEGRDILQVLI